MKGGVNVPDKGMLPLAYCEGTGQFPGRPYLELRNMDGHCMQ